MRNPSLDQLADRAHAETVACQSCGAPAGQTCTRTDMRGHVHPIENFPAHHSRLKRADRWKRLNAEHPQENP